MRQQGELLADILEVEGEPKLLGVPIGIFDAIIGVLRSTRTLWLYLLWLCLLRLCLPG